MIDFGSSSRIPLKKECYFKTYNGTPEYASPEIVKGLSYQGPEAEVWALGVLLYIIVFAQFPFIDSEDIASFDGRLYYPRYIDSDLQELLEGMLWPDPNERLTLDDVTN